jgi:hypothetical protein
MIMQIIVIAVFTIVYTNQISSIREAGLEQSSTFPSVPETRVLIEKRDGSEFTPAEIESFRSMRVVNEVYEEAMNFFNETNLFVSLSGGDYYGRGNIRATDSANMLSQSDIEGELPTAINEIVISSYWDFNVGDIVTLNAGNAYEWYGEEGNDTSIGTFTVTGIDKLDREILYFSEAYLMQPTSDEAIINYGLLAQIEQRLNYDISFEIGGHRMWTYKDDFSNFTEDIYIDGEGNRTVLTGQTLTFMVYDINYNEFSYEMNNLTISVPEDMYGARIHPDAHQEIKDYFLDLWESQYTVSPKNYLSLSVDGYYAGNRVINSVDADLYKVYYPANISGAMREIQVFFLSFLAAILLTLFGLFLYSIVHAVTKNVMNARKKDFAIFRSIGANKTTLAQLVVLEQVIMSTVGFIITMIIINIISANITLIAADIQYMELRDYLILLAAFMFFGAWLGLRFNKKVFKQSVIETLTQSRGE